MCPSRAIIAMVLVLCANTSSRAESLKDQWLNFRDSALGAAHKPHPSVVRVIVPEGHGTQSLGSGTLVDVNANNGLVVTNWHVIEAARGPITVVFPDGFKSAAQVLKSDRDWDLAALLIQKPHVAAVPIAKQAPAPGDVLTIAGYGSGPYRAASGRCTQYVSPGGNHPYEIVELAASARQGDSGGPIFNARGELAGVLFGEAGGTTSGSFCRRVHTFLATLNPASMTAPGTMLAQPTTPSGSEQPLAITALAPTQRLPGTPEPPATVAALPPATPAPPVVPEARLQPTIHEVSEFKHSAAPIAPSVSIEHAEVAELNWEALLGQTRPEQIKTALAVVGVLALLLWTHRWVQAAPEPEPKPKRRRALN